jgi:hypothetical protein
MKIDINAKKDLKQVFDLLHDSFVDLGSLRFKDNILSLLVKREDLDSSNYKIKNYIIFKTAKVPLILTNLTLHNVSRYEIIDDRGIVIYCLNNFTLKDNILFVNFCEHTKLKLEFKDSVRVFLEDIKALEEYSASWILPFWFSKPSEQKRPANLLRRMIIPP